MSFMEMFYGAKVAEFAVNKVRGRKQNIDENVQNKKFETRK